MFIQILMILIQIFNKNINCRILVVFDYMVGDTLSNIKPVAIVIELFICGRKLNTVILCSSHKC